jgi:hypothetical protein
VTRRRHSGPHDVRRGEHDEGFRLAFREFLTGAGLWAVGLLLLEGLVHVLDWVRPEALEPMHRVLTMHLFKSSNATASLLQSISTTVITVASITFSFDARGHPAIGQLVDRAGLRPIPAAAH